MLLHDALARAAGTSSPATSGATSCATTVTSWLNASQLGQYAQAFARQGYDDLDGIARMNSAQVDRMLEVTEGDDRHEVFAFALAHLRSERAARHASPAALQAVRANAASVQTGPNKRPRSQLLPDAAAASSAAGRPDPEPTAAQRQAAEAAPAPAVDLIDLCSPAQPAAAAQGEEAGVAEMRGAAVVSAAVAAEPEEDDAGSAADLSPSKRRPS